MQQVDIEHQNVARTARELDGSRLIMDVSGRCSGHGSEWRQS
jgi:hypothetical protein